MGPRPSYNVMYYEILIVRLTLLFTIGLSLCESLSQPRSQSLSWDVSITAEEIQRIKDDMMKVHTIVISSNLSNSSQAGILPSSNNQTNVMNGHHKINELNTENQEQVSEKEDLKSSKGEKLSEEVVKDHSNDYAYRLLSGRETLEPSKELLQNDAIIQLNDDDVYIVPDAKEREELLKSMYNLNKEPIFIPEEVKNRKYKAKTDENPQQIKKQKILDNQLQDNGDENVDLETMLSSFVG